MEKTLIKMGKGSKKGRIKRRLKRQTHDIGIRKLQNSVGTKSEPISISNIGINFSKNRLQSIFEDWRV